MMGRHDGGKDSGVLFYGFEWKRGFSVGLLRFAPGSREAFHSNAFNAWTLWLRGVVREDTLHVGCLDPFVTCTSWRAGILKRTLREHMHRVIADEGGAWALTIRGPWVDTWQEVRKGKIVTLTHGRREVVE